MIRLQLRIATHLSWLGLRPLGSTNGSLPGITAIVLALLFVTVPNNNIWRCNRHIENARVAEQRSSILIGSEPLLLQMFSVERKSETWPLRSFSSPPMQRDYRAI